MDDWVEPGRARTDVVRILVLDDLGYPIDTLNEESELFAIAICPEIDRFDKLAAQSFERGGEWHISPFDVYLADMMLCTDPNSCERADHRETGLHSDGAGFVSALMWALRYPRAPQMIIPFSVKPESFERTLTLCLTLAPANLGISDKPLVKGTVDSYQIFSACAQRYREAVSGAAQRGEISVRWGGEVDADGKAVICDGPLSEDCYVEIRAAGATRRIKVGSLFFDELDLSRRQVPPDAVADFLDQCRSMDRLDDISRVQAQIYLVMANSPQSRERYRLIAKLAQDEGRAVEFDASVPDAMSVKFGEDTRAVRRLVLLYLLVAAYRDSYVHRTATDAFSQDDSGVQEEELTVSGLIEPQLEQLVKDGHREAADKLRAQLEEVLAAGTTVEDVVFNSPDYCAFPDRLYRTIDPLPRRPQAPTFHLSGRMPKRIQEAGINLTDILAGDISCLSEAEVRKVRLYAADHVPTGFPLPTWMR